MKTQGARKTSEWFADCGSAWRVQEDRFERSFHEPPELFVIHVHSPSEGPAHWIVQGPGVCQRTFYDNDDAPRAVLRHLGAARFPSYGPIGKALREFLGSAPMGLSLPNRKAPVAPEPNEQTKTVI